MITSNGHNGAHHPTDEAIDNLYAWFPAQDGPGALSRGGVQCHLEAR